MKRTAKEEEVVVVAEFMDEGDHHMRQFATSFHFFKNMGF